jgi:two-component system chemotaxis response regulator CheB
MKGASVTQIVRVLVVDDSAYVRKVVSQMLSRSPFLEVVGTARDGEEALERVAELQPDVVTCDLNMPIMDGPTFVREQMARRPLPIIIISIAAESGPQVLAALDAGAIDFVQKPTALATERLMDMSEELIEKVKAAAQAPKGGLQPSPSAALSVLRPVARAGPGSFDIVVIGISTGGPQGLRRVLPRLPAAFPVPVALVMHMPLGYTETYARNLDSICELRVVEAAEGMDVTAGTVLVAPAGRHLTFRRDGESVRTHLDVRPLDTPHRPSVDVLFHSAAEVYNGRVLGIVMTGMGSDGREGAAWIKARGGTVLTEAEETCVVFGMPRSVVEAGLSDASVALDDMAGVMLERV